MIRGGLRRALGAVVALACLITLVQGLSIAASDQPTPAIGVYWVVIGLLCLVVGALVWDRRPINGTGPLLVLLGGTVLLASGSNQTDLWAALPGHFFAALPVAALFHVVLAFPSGRLTGRVDRALVGTLWVLALTAGGAVHVLDPTPGMPLTAPDRFGWLAGYLVVAQPVSRVVALVGVVRLLRRWRRLRVALGRRPVGLVYLYGVATIVSLAAANTVRPFTGWTAEQFFLLQVTLIGGFPLVVAAALRFGVLARTAGVDELAAWFGTDADRRPHPRDALARALGDPTLALLYEVPAGSGRFVDHDGHPRTAAPGGPGRGVVRLDRQDALVEYDAVLLPDAAPVVRAAQVAALAVDHERLTAELLASEAEVRSSRRRLVEAGAAERRRIAQDLHDGVQSWLVASALRAGRLRLRVAAADPDLAAELAGLVGDLDRAVTELRHVAEGVMPALLREQGLFAALDEHVRAMPLPSSVDLRGDDTAIEPAVATAAWFIAAESISNALKHSGAGRVELEAAVEGGRLLVEVRDDGAGGADVQPAGRGLPGIVDRAAALGGRVEVDSAPGRGTRVRAELPCAS